LDAAIDIVDHRPLGLLSRHGAEEDIRAMRSIFDVSGDVGIRVDDILGLEAHAFLVHWVQLGTIRDSGGAYERHFLLRGMRGAHGLMTRQELFDPDCSAEALVRFDELVLSPVEGLTPTSTPVRSEHDATRLSDRFAAAWAARDWDRIAAIFAADFRLIDRRSYARIELNRNQHLESLRFRFEMPSSRIVSELLATRGSRLALTHGRFELAGDDIGPSESEWLVVEESGGGGRGGAGGGGRARPPPPPPAPRPPRPPPAPARARAPRAGPAVPRAP